MLQIMQGDAREKSNDYNSRREKLIDYTHVKPKKNTINAAQGTASCFKLG